MWEQPSIVDPPKEHAHRVGKQEGQVETSQQALVGGRIVCTQPVQRIFTKGSTKYNNNNNNNNNNKPDKCPTFIPQHQPASHRTSKLL